MFIVDREGSHSASRSQVLGSVLLIVPLVLSGCGGGSDSGAASTVPFDVGERCPGNAGQQDCIGWGLDAPAGTTFTADEVEVEYLGATIARVPSSDTANPERLTVAGYFRVANLDDQPVTMPPGNETEDGFRTSMWVDGTFWDWAELRPQYPYDFELQPGAEVTIMTAHAVLSGAEDLPVSLRVEYITTDVGYTADLAVEGQPPPADVNDRIVASMEMLAGETGQPLAAFGHDEWLVELDGGYLPVAGEDVAAVSLQGLAGTPPPQPTSATAPEIVEITPSQRGTLLGEGDLESIPEATATTPPLSSSADCRVVGTVDGRVTRDPFHLAFTPRPEGQLINVRSIDSGLPTADGTPAWTHVREIRSWDDELDLGVIAVLETLGPVGQDEVVQFQVTDAVSQSDLEDAEYSPESMDDWLTYVPGLSGGDHTWDPFDLGGSFTVTMPAYRTVNDEENGPVDVSFDFMCQ